MKIKCLFPIALCFVIGNLNAQQVPTGPSISPFSPPPVLEQHAWYRGGNAAGAAGGIKNIFGTLWNSPIYTQTFGVNRTKLNGTVPYTVNGFTAARDGYMLLGPDAPVAGGTLYSAKGAFSLLHLNGTTTLAAIELGYRPWMKTGITFTENSDLMYVGRKSEGIPGSPTADQTDAVISWSDDGTGPPYFGPDNLRFLFTFGNASGTGAPGADLTGGGMDGREVMRMIPQGNIGVGPRFDNLNQPTSTYHQHQENNLSSWMQITNQMITTGAVTSPGPTAINPTDGFRFGILGASTAAQNGNAFVYNQEQRHIIFSTGNTTPANMAATNERFRITAIENQTTLAPGYGINNPGGLNTTFTRVSISEDPATPVTRPLSLLHIGYNTQGATNDGWRPWMDVGMFASRSSDNVYLGLKAEPGIVGISGFDRQDAVLSWGDNQVPTGIPSNGPDNFRFIFTSTTAASGGGTPPATSLNGLEGGRMTPTSTTGIFTGFGGDPTFPNLYSTGTPNPGNTLEVNSWGATTTPGGSSGLRFTNLTDASPTTPNTGNMGVLAVNASGDVVYVPGGNVGNYCFATTPSPLVSDYQIPMNDKNYHFSDNGSAVNANNVGIGTNCGALNARLVVVNPVMQFGINTVTNNAAFSTNYAVRGSATNTFPGGLEAIGVEGNALNAGPTWNVGVNGNARSAVQTNYGGRFTGSGLNTTNIGAQAAGIGAGPTSQNYGINANASGGLTATAVRGNGSGATVNFGGHFTSLFTGSATNYGIYSEASGATTNYAGYFVGDVFATGTITPSDINLKENIDTIRNADSLLNLLKPVYFTYKQTGDAARFNFATIEQMGLLAQEAETVIPNVVKDVIHPASYDTLGTMISPAFTFKTVDYQKIIPLLIAGYKSQQSKIDSLKDQNDAQDSINNSLQTQLNQLAGLINDCCNNRSGNAGSMSGIFSQDIDLKDGQSIVLEQNIPNPFAEQTTINYFLPESVVKAQMLFYNAQGKLIQSVDLTQKGKGSLNVFASDLSNGIYTYTLVADGKIIETKKMLKQQ